MRQLLRLSFGREFVNKVNFHFDRFTVRQFCIGATKIDWHRHDKIFTDPGNIERLCIDMIDLFDLTLGTSDGNDIRRCLPLPKLSALEEAHRSTPH